MKTCDMCLDPTRNRKHDAHGLLLCVACRNQAANPDALIPEDRCHGELLTARRVEAEERLTSMQRRRATDLLFDLPHWTAFMVGRAARDKTELLLSEAQWDALHIVRSGLRDYLDQLEATEQEATS